LAALVAKAGKGDCVPVSTDDPAHTFARRLLDNAERVGPAARAIDDALKRGSNDAVVHAAAMWLGFWAGNGYRLKRSNARGWIYGLHELIQSGHLDVAADSLPRLIDEFPGVPYLENMALVFDRMPPPGDTRRDRFVDDRDCDVQVVKAPGADTVVIAFCGGHHTLGIPMNLLDRWLAQLRSHLVYLRDWHKVGYLDGVATLGRDMKFTIKNLNQLVSDLEVRHVVCLGNSSGATGAARYARAIGAERLLAMSPITGGAEYSQKVVPHMRAGDVRWWGDLVPLYRDGDGVRTHIVYGENNEGDRQQSVRMIGLPGVTVEALQEWEAHHLIHGLLRAGRLEPLLRWMVTG
jgi:hypothetical protein